MISATTVRNRLLYGSGNVSVLRSNRGRERRGKAFVFLAILADSTASYEVLKLFVGAQAQHFLATAGGISCSQIFVHDVEKLLELERSATREHSNQFLGHKIRNSARECVFLENSH